MACRFDKFAWSVRLAKTRAISAEAIQKGKIRLNGVHVKPSREVKLGDEIQVIRNTATFTYRVTQLLGRRVGAKLAIDYIADITPDEEREKLKMYQIAQSNYREHGTGKPSKKDRRDMDRFLDDWQD
ncbi:MAG: RNA-binding S4 domain-containing protein [Crocinitomicaceae bacterium]|nr:RNA-binding S4 domain-containing protein [Crocinitomicaceae bacterium]MDG1657588.1 RNA-binding S4 domain-containing protein [Crocinitomicaceae bacterium]MDG2440856.1 RNA-binding S4 domain-containing protein [Crocinitomicaceae bacterium]|tara:strand:+ start:11441 stop:11821 length:381 start_codon:yes stop_codon:yes gene_type:complete